jgi:hypothetical protein
MMSVAMMLGAGKLFFGGHRAGDAIAGQARARRNAVSCADFGRFFGARGAQVALGRRVGRTEDFFGKMRGGKPDCTPLPVGSWPLTIRVREGPVSSRKTKKHQMP